MAKKDRKVKVRSPGDKWFVYVVQCADGSLYTGITTDLSRRCKDTAQEPHLDTPGAAFLPS